MKERDPSELSPEGCVLSEEEWCVDVMLFELGADECNAVNMAFDDIYAITIDLCCDRARGHPGKHVCCHGRIRGHIIEVQGMGPICKQNYNGGWGVCGGCWEDEDKSLEVDRNS